MKHIVRAMLGHVCAHQKCVRIILEPPPVIKISPKNICQVNTFETPNPLLTHTPKECLVSLKRCAFLRQIPQFGVINSLFPFQRWNS